MALTAKFKIKVENGRSTILDRDKRLKFIMALPDGDYVETIKKQRKPRSNQQNRYMHGVIFKLIAEEIGDSVEEVKSAMKNKFLKYETKSGLEAIKDTSDLSTVELENFNEKCRRWASSFLNIYIPLPNEIDWDNYDEILG